MIWGTGRLCGLSLSRKKNILRGLDLENIYKTPLSLRGIYGNQCGEWFPLKSAFSLKKGIREPGTANQPNVFKGSDCDQSQGICHLFLPQTLVLLIYNRAALFWDKRCWRPRVRRGTTENAPNGEFFLDSSVIWK